LELSLLLAFWRDSQPQKSFPSFGLWLQDEEEDYWLLPDETEERRGPRDHLFAMAILFQEILCDAKRYFYHSLMWKGPRPSRPQCLDLFRLRRKDPEWKKTVKALLKAVCDLSEEELDYLSIICCPIYNNASYKRPPPDEHGVQIRRKIPASYFTHTAFQRMVTQSVNAPGSGDGDPIRGADHRAEKDKAKRTPKKFLDFKKLRKELKFGFLLVEDKKADKLFKRRYC